LFVQDGDAAIFVLIPQETKLGPGDRMLVRGYTRDGFRPIVIAGNITLLPHGALPNPVPATYDELISAQHDAMLVTVRAVVRTADFMARSDLRSMYLQLIADDGYIDALVENNDPSKLEGPAGRRSGRHRAGCGNVRQQDANDWDPTPWFLASGPEGS
jgi:hypothetical protein